MFKSALSALSSTVVGAAKNTINSYKPSSLLQEGGAFERISQQGIANMSYRSPVMADLAQTMLNNVQLEMRKRQQIKDHVKSDSSKDFRAAVTAKMGDKTSSKKIDEEMSRILEKINKSIDKNGKEETQKTALFQEYSKYFDDFKSANDPKKSVDGVDASATEQGGGVGDPAVLHNIANNTQRTYNAIEELAAQRAVGGSSGVSGGGQGGSTSFIDPVTGMPSMRAAVGSIGGSFLGKIFDDETISKFAKKTKNLFGLNDEPDEELQPAKKPETPVNNVAPEPAKKPETPIVPDKIPRPKPGITTKAIDDVIGDLSLDLNSDHENKTVFDSIKKTKKATIDNKSESAKESIATISTENTSESAKEIAVDKKHNDGKLLKVAEDSLEELKKLNSADDKEKASDALNPRGTGSSLMDKAIQKGKDKIVDKVAPKVKAVARKGVDKVIDTGKKAASYFSKGATVVEGAATAGKAAGAVAEGGSLLGTAARVIGGIAAAPAVAAAAPWVLGAAAAGAVGYGAYKMFGGGNDDSLNAKQATPSSINPAMAPKIVPAKSTVANEVTKLSDDKEKQDAKAKQPIIINNSAVNTQTSASSKQPSSNLIVGTNVRNQDSTFERVQMQDFWHRTA